MTGAARIIATAAAALGVVSLAACGTDPAAPPTRTVTQSRVPSVSGTDIGLQLRPVLDAQPATPGECPTPSAGTPASSSPATVAPVTACAADGKLVYSLGPAAVTGTQWETLSVVDDPSSGTSQVLGTLDPTGSGALSQATAELVGNEMPRDQLAFYVDGVVESAPTVQQPIYGGVVLIAGGFTRDEAQQLVEQLTAH